MSPRETLTFSSHKNTPGYSHPRAESASAPPFFFICQLTQDLIKFRESVVQSDQLPICIHKTMFRFGLADGFLVRFFHHIPELQPNSVDRLMFKNTRMRRLLFKSPADAGKNDKRLIKPFIRSQMRGINASNTY